MQKKKSLLALYKESFDDSVEYVDNFFSKYYTAKNTKYILADGQIVSALHVVYKHLSCWGKVSKIPFLVGVATKLQYRKQGYFKRLMAKTLTELARQNYPFVLLYPADRILYEKVGFVTVSRVGHFKAKYDGRDSTFVDASPMQVCSFFNDAYSSVSILQYRTLSETKKIISRWKAEGFLPRIVSRDGKFACVACSDVGVEEAIGDLSVLNGVKNFDEKVFVDYSSREQPFAMARLVSLVALLKNLNYQTFEGEYRFKVIDSFCQFNQMIVCLSFKYGKPIIKKSKKYDFCVDATQLARLAFGEEVPNCPLNSLIKKGEVVFVDMY